ncbi:MAG TPA: hypothetical protein VHO03_12470 [Ignavibacteriales bacterium]|nr:hypothetical protein [Ignavibacteriales bacterium]
MSSIKPKNRPVIIVGMAILFSFVLSYIPEGVNILFFKTKPVSFFADIKPDSLLSLNREAIHTSGINSASLPPAGKVIFASFPSEVLFEPFVRLLGEDGNSLENITGLQKMEEGNSALQPVKDVPLSGNVAQMKNFYAALKQSRSKSVRIAHYGDSGLEGDLIDADIRQALQKEFGGMGVGFLPVTSQDVSFRVSTGISFSPDWKTSSVIIGKEANIPLGINGFAFIPKAGSWVKYNCLNRYSSASAFRTIKIYYTDAKNSSIRYSFNNGQEQSAPLRTGKGIKELLLTVPSNGTSFKMTATQAEQAKFYGISMETGPGLYLDNFAWRGNTGTSFRDISPEVMKDFNKYLDYKLIILSFGQNMVSTGSVNFGWYESQMINVINELKSSFPQASILLVGVGDRAIKRGTRFATDPNILKMVESQKKIAQSTGVTFWNMFEAMGGENSMVAWAGSGLAFKDYEHISLDGSKKVAQMLSKAILNGYYSQK